MAVCLDYQTVYLRRDSTSVSWHLCVALVVVMVGTLIGQIWVRTEVTDLGYQISEEQRIQAELTNERQELELERVVLHRPDALADRARKTLGFRPAEKEQLFRIGR